MHHALKVFIPFICFLFISNAYAQYEALLNDPDALQAIVENGGFGKKTTQPEPRRLSAPEPHKTWVRGMERSNDGEYLLTYDIKTIKIWDKKRRVLITTFSTENDILKAHFVDEQNTVCVITEWGLDFYADFDFKANKPTKNVPFTRIADAAYDSENQVIYLAHETYDTYATVIRYDIAKDTSTTIYKSSFREFLITKDPNLYDKHMRRITYSAKYQMLALKFAYRDVFKLIDLRSNEELSDIAKEKRPYGFLPNGELLSVTKNSTDCLINYINPVTYELKEIASFPSSSSYNNARVYMPHNAENHLIVRRMETTMILDPQTNKTIQHKKSEEFTTAAIALNEPKSLILGQVDSGNFGSQRISMNQFDFDDGTYLRTWGATAFLPQSLYPSTDAFEFLIQQEFETRRVKITENSLSSEVIPTPRVIYPLAAYYNNESNRWFLGDSRKPLFIEFNPESKFAPSQTIEIKAQPEFQGVHFFDRTADDALLALHGRTSVIVYDPIAEKAVLSAKLETTGGFAFKKSQMIAISPNGKYVAYVYQNDAPVAKTWHLVCQQISNGEVLWERQHSKKNGTIDHLKFSDDGRLLYHCGLDSEGLSAVYSTTGELFQKYNIKDSASYSYNQSGTLAVTWTRQNIQIISLPSGEILEELPNDTLYQRLQFIGSDGFLIGSSQDVAELSLFNIKENKKVAQLYLFEDTNNWLVRNPTSGLFDSDQKSQEQLYFVQGKQISPLAAYLEDFYRPRLLGSLIKGLTLNPSIDLADLKRAPRVNMQIAGVSQRGLTVEDEFESFEVEGSEVTLEIKATAEGSPIEDIRIYHNGKLVSGAARGLFVEDDDEWDQSQDEVFTKNSVETFELTPGSNRFRVIAINEQGTESIPDELAVTSANASQEATGGIALHMVCIGINEYRNPDYTLNYARADAEALEAALTKNNEAIFTRVERYQLYDSEATRENIIATLELVKQNAGPRDAFIFYYAGHGIMSDDNNPQFFIAPYEITQLYGYQGLLKQLAVSSDELLGYSRDILAQKQLFILDACQSAGALKTVAVRGASEEKAIAQLARSSGTHWLTATGSEQFATEFDKLGHGAFTFTLLEALNGAADTGDGIISVNELKAYIEAKVPEVTEEHKGTAQYPASYGYGQDFPLSIIP